MGACFGAAAADGSSYSRQECGHACENALLLLLRVMTKDEVQQNRSTHNAAISACEKGAEWEVALLLLTEMATVRSGPTQTVFGMWLLSC